MHMIDLRANLRRKMRLVTECRRFLEWTVNTLWRTLMAFVPRLARPDDAYARDLLTKPEYRLYCAMDARDRAHACAVAKRLVSLHPQASAELRRAALLHDVGKLGSGYNPLARILAALYTPKTMSPAPRLRGLRGAWQVKRYHGSYGAALIREVGGSARVAEIVTRHHQPGTDADACALKDIDARF